MGYSHEPTKEVRDPIYDFVELSEAEWDIVNAPEFERLRDIRQLAMGHLVYPGANHTRFEHSIGTLHLSTLLFDSLVGQDREILRSEFGLPNNGLDRAKQLLRLAALLHDVGHPPFSHTGEQLMPASGKDADSSRISHEEMSARIVRESDIGGRIESHFGPQGISVEEVIAIATDYRYSHDLKQQPYHQFLHDLLTAELGSDRIDYLLRDAYHSGQRSGVFDYRRLVGCVRLIPPPKEAEPGFRIGFDSGGWLVAEQMIVARYLMYQSLYFHRTKRIFEIHLESFLRDWLQERYGQAELPIDVKEYSRLTDSLIWSELRVAGTDAKRAGNAHAMRFIDRNHMRLAKELILADNCKMMGGRRIPNKMRFDGFVKDVSIVFGTQVVCDQPDHSATRMFEDTHKILVLLDGQPRYLDHISEIVRGMSDKIWRGRIYSDRSCRSDVRKWCEEWLAEHSTSDSQFSGTNRSGQQ